MITYLARPGHLDDSQGHSISSADPAGLLDFLVFSCPNKPLSELRAFWDLDAAISALNLPPAVRETLTKTERVVWNGYRLFYRASPGMFAVNKNHNEVMFYELQQFFPDDDCPATVQGVQAKADELLEMLGSVGVTPVTNLTSPIAVAEGSHLLDGYRDNIPTIFDFPESQWGAFEYAMQCTPREWVSAYIMGSWAAKNDPELPHIDGLGIVADELFDYDISSAYPAMASQLIDLRDCSFTKSTRMLDGAYYGFVHGDLWLNPEHPYAYCSPVVIELDGKPSNPVGHLPTDYYPLDLIRFVERYDMGKFKTESGWFISPYNAVRPRFPFRDLMAHLYELRARSDLAAYFVKRVMNGIIGRLLQTVKKDGDVTRYGRQYNPIYHALITSPTKIRVAECIIQQGIAPEELVHVGVDGIKATKRLNLAEYPKMGQWVSHGSQPTIILSPGRIYTPTRPKGGLTYHLLSAIAEARPNLRRYEFDGQVIDLDAIASDAARKFNKLPHRGRDVFSQKYRSEPIVL